MLTLWYDLDVAFPKIHMIQEQVVKAVRPVKPTTGLTAKWPWTVRWTETNGTERAAGANHRCIIQELAEWLRGQGRAAENSVKVIRGRKKSEIAG